MSSPVSVRPAYIPGLPIPSYPPVASQPVYPQQPTSSPYYPQQPTYPSVPGTTPGVTPPGMGGDTLSTVGSAIGAVTPGAIAGYKVLRDGVSLLTTSRVNFNRNAGFRRNVITGHISPTRGRASGGGIRTNTRVAYRTTPFTALGAAIKSSVIWGTVISAGLNGYKMFKGQQTFAVTASNVVGDSLSSLVGGAAGAVASMAGTTMLAGVLTTGPMLTLAGIGLGIAGFMIADGILRNTDLFKNVQSTVYRMFA